MIRSQLTLLVITVFVVSAGAQKIQKPTLTPKPCTSAQTVVIQEGIALHDAKKFDEAIAKYQQVLGENPDCPLAMYELALSYYGKSDTTKAMETAYKGARYKGDELPLFYQVMANVIDDVGKPDEAIKIYRDAIKMLEDDAEMRPHLASLNYNMGVTFIRQKKYNEARGVLKQAVEANPRYASPHFVLAEVFLGTRYRIPAFMAALRFISLEFVGPRTQRAAAIIKQIAGASTKKTGENKVDITLDLMAPKDEGDYGMLELMLAITDDEIKPDKEKGPQLSPQEKFADRIDSFVGLLDDKDKKNRSTFAGKQYFPFLQEAKNRGHLKPLSFIVLVSLGDAEALKWTEQNEKAVDAALNWAKNYPPTQ